MYRNGNVTVISVVLNKIFVTCFAFQLMNAKEGYMTVIEMQTTSTLVKVTGVDVNPVIEEMVDFVKVN